LWSQAQFGLENSVRLTVGEAVRRIRKRIGQNTTDFGARVGITASAVSKYENGKISPGRSVLLLLQQMAETDEEREVISAALGGDALILPEDGPESVVRQIRKEIGATRVEFCQRMGIDVLYLKELEEGEKAPVPTLADRLHKLAIEMHRPDLALAVTQGRWGVKHVIHPGETLISTGKETVAAGDAEKELHEMVEEICQSGYDEAVRLARSGLILAREHVRSRKPAAKSKRG
jgi:transcriptional regulator with XRE-family HTH domain